MVAALRVFGAARCAAVLPAESGSPRVRVGIVESVVSAADDQL